MSTIEPFIGPGFMLMTILLLTYVLPKLARQYYQKKDLKAVSVLESHETAYAGKAGLLCTSFDEPKKGQAQFFGTVLSKDIKPGMLLSYEDGAPWTVKAIYLDRYDADKTSDIAAARTKDVAIVVETTHNFDKKVLKVQLNSAGFIFLKQI
jgi:hypothetical protein